MFYKKILNGEHTPEKLVSRLIGQERKEDPAQRPLASGPDPQPPPGEAAEPLSPELEFPPDSAVFQLWRIWQPDAPSPLLSLAEALSAGLFPEDALPLEKKRLEELLEQDAHRRLAALSASSPFPQEEPEGDSSPPPLPAECHVYLAQNGMAAWGILFPPIGGGPELDLEEFGKVMLQCRVSAGIDSPAIAEMIARTRYFSLCLIARGTPVQEGADGYIHDHYSRQRFQGIQTDEAGRVDYRAQCYVQGVEKGGTLCDVVPPSPGVDGLRVDGIVVNPRPVRPAKAPKGSNTAVSEDGSHLIATMDGHVEFSGGVFQVRPSLEIAGDVDYSTGNIDFRGNVHVRGDVRENFSIRATGTVVIDGLVEGATVDAGGDIVIANGVLGDNKALLKSRGSVRAKYLENCVVYSRDGTYSECILASRVFSDHQISVTSGRGTVIGGGLTAAVSIEAHVIGAKSGRETELTLGVLPYVQEELQNIEIDLRSLRKELAELDRQLRHAEARQGISDGSASQAKNRLRRSVLVMKEDKLVKRRQDLEQLQPDLSKCRLECGTVYPTTRLTIGPSFRAIDHLWAKCTAVYDMEHHEIKFV